MAAREVAILDLAPFPGLRWFDQSLVQRLF